MDDTPRHVKQVTFFQEATPVLMQLSRQNQVCAKVFAWLNIKQLVLIRRLKQVPLFRALKLDQESVDVVVVRCKPLLFLD